MIGFVAAILKEAQEQADAAGLSIQEQSDHQIMRDVIERYHKKLPRLVDMSDFFRAGPTTVTSLRSVRCLNIHWIFSKREPFPRRIWISLE